MAAPVDKILEQKVIESYQTGKIVKDVRKELSVEYPKLNVQAIYYILQQANILRGRGNVTKDGTLKVCAKCRILQSVENFGFRKSARGTITRRSNCNPCQQIINNQFKTDYRNKTEEQKSAILEQNRKSRLKKPEALMYKSCKSRALKKGIDFSIDIEDIIIPEYCPIFKVKLEFSRELAAYNSPSVDRIDTTKGYIKGNIQIISWRANRLKSNASLEELETLVNYLKEKQNEILT